MCICASSLALLGAFELCYKANMLQSKYKQAPVKPAIYEVLYEQVYAMLLKRKQGTCLCLYCGHLPVTS